MFTGISCSSFKYRFYQYVAATGSCFTLLSIGMHFGWLSIGLPKLLDGSYDFTITSDQASWLATMMSIGSLVGDIGAYLLINTFGKKNMIFWSTIPLVVSWILTTVGPSAPYVFVGKLIAGMADGVLFTTVPTFMSEIADPKIRGILGSTYSVTLVVGMVLMNILMYLLDMKTAGYIAIVFNIPILFTFPFLPDSAYFYLLKKNPDAAKASLQRYTGLEEVENDLERITEAVKEEMENEGGIMDIVLNKTCRKALIMAIALCVLNQFTGIVGVLGYCTTVFEESKSFMDPQLSNIIFFIVYCIAVGIAAFVVDNFGRRTMLIVSSTGVVVCLVSFATFLVLKQHSVIQMDHVEYVEIILLLVYISLYAFGLNSIPILVASEIFTPNMKGIGLCLVNLSYSLSSTVVLKYFSWIKDAAGMYLPFYTFAFFAFVVLLFAIFILPETKGKTLEEIQNLLRGKDKTLEMYNKEKASS